MSSTSTPAHHESFTFLREQYVDSLNITVQEFEHKITGASHIHIASDSNENVFLVALRTVPHDSTGVAHILEHTALCGSEKYPVRDPFFMMTRRSLNTFMNAFTSSDWTAYPFASMNKKDFNNLLDVYLDAVFFANLDQLDFAQEGHRLEFEDMENSDSALQFKGVVFNEMKGAMSSVPSQLWQTICKYLFPTNTYHFNSGGEPDAIPDLSYEQLCEFYKTHYHPSNSIFMTFGDIPACEHQKKFELQALQRFEKLDYSISVNDEKRYFSPVRVQESYANNDDDLSRKTHVAVGWLLGHSTNLEESLRAQLLSSVLLDNSASPLMNALETTDLGTGPSPLCGLDDSQKECSFICGLAGCETHTADEVEALITSVIEDVVENGIPQQDLEAALHQLELHQREIGGDSYPYGLQLILTSLSSATHRGDPVKLLNIDPVITKLREEIQSPDFIRELAKKYLLDNPHKVRLVFTPDSEIAERKAQAEKDLLEQIRSKLSDPQKQQIIDQALALKARQEQQDDEDILPKVGLNDVPNQENHVTGNIRQLANGSKLTSYPTGTNGLVYQQLIFKCPELTREELNALSLYSNVVTEVGLGTQNYIDIQRKQAQISGGFSAYSSFRSNVSDKAQLNAHIIFSAKSLNRNQKAITELLLDTVKTARFDEQDRINDLIAQMNNNAEQRVTNNGHALAMSAAAAGISPGAKLQHQLTGLAGYKYLKDLNAGIQKNDESNIGNIFSSIHSKITQNTFESLLIAEPDLISEFEINFEQLFNVEASQAGSYQASYQKQKVKEAWITNSQVNFCAKAFETVTMDHEDAAALVALGGFLRNGYLHTAIREQGGAYGGGASQDNNAGVFRFYSYRDPRLQETFEEFDNSIAWLLENKHAEAKLEEAILGAASNLDHSESPQGRAKRCFHSDLNGRTLEKRLAFRKRLLSLTLNDLRDVAEKYLSKENENSAVVSGSSQLETLESLGFSIQHL